MRPVKSTRQSAVLLSTPGRAHKPSWASLLAAALALFAVLTPVAKSNAQEALRPDHQRPEQVRAISDEEDVLTLSIKTEWLSKYLADGIVYSDTPVIQESIAATFGYFSAATFLNYDTGTDELDELSVYTEAYIPIRDTVYLYGGYNLFASPSNAFRTENELTAGIALERDALTLYAGYIMSFPDSAHDVAVQLTLEQVPLAPPLDFVHNINGEDAGYLQLSASHTQALIRSERDLVVEISVEASLNYNRHYYLDKTGFTHLETKLSFPVQWTESMTLEPSVLYSLPLMDHMDLDHDVVYGLGIGFEF
jgi:hypothetical protein